MFDALRISVLINRTLRAVFYALSLAQKFLNPTYDFEFEKEHIMDEKNVPADDHQMVIASVGIC
ncbi:hypothetical protein N9L40_02700 [Rhodobacteraceae bacterium]|nr:hypothetical protein [Paracoccaceae bacterium]